MSVERRDRAPVSRALPAGAALALMVVAVGVAVAVAIDRFPRGIVVLLLLAGALTAAWWALLRPGVRRTIGLGAALLMAAGAVVLILTEGRVLADLAIAAAFVLALAAARAAFAQHVDLPEAPRPQRPVLFYNPKSGGGKATRFHLEEEARARGIEPIGLKPGDHLEALVREAVARGADGLAMAGGDGSQAIVAAVAAELGLPYACIPAGTRNHFALDLGVDRNDVVGALDAFVNGGERVVDLAEVNGRVFVNNVSLGVYAEAVQQEGYREAKLRTIADSVGVLGPGEEGLDLRWTDGDGRDHASAAVLLVSNDRYRLGRALGSGTRPRLDAGVLGITVMGESRANGGRMQEWTAPTFEVRSGASVPAGIDGEAVLLEPPLRFVSRPGVLRVRIAPQHPGASPSAAIPETPWQTFAALARLALGRSG